MKARLFFAAFFILIFLGQSFALAPTTTLSDPKKLARERSQKIIQRMILQRLAQNGKPLLMVVKDIGVLPLGIVPSNDPEIDRKYWGKPIFIRNANQLRKGRVEAVPRWDREALYLELHAFYRKGSKKGEKRLLKMTPRFDLEMKGFFDNAWGVGDPPRIAVDPEEEKNGKRKLAEAVIAILNGQSISEAAKTVSPFQTVVRNEMAEVAFGVRRPFDPIFIKGSSFFRKEMVLEICPVCDKAGNFVLEIFVVRMVKGEELKRKILMRPRFNPTMFGYFDNSWGRWRWRQQPRTVEIYMLSPKSKLQRPLSPLRQLQEAAAEAIRSGGRLAPTWELPRFPVTVVSINGVIGLGSVTVKTGTSPFYVQNRHHLKKGMQVEIAPRISSKGNLYLELREIVQEQGIERGREIPFMPRLALDRKENGFFDNDWKPALPQKPADESAREKFLNLLFKLLKKQPVKKEEMAILPFKIKVRPWYETGRVFFASVPKRDPEFPEKVRGKAIYLADPRLLQEDLVVEIAPKFNEAGELVLEIYKADKKKLKFSAQWNPDAPGFFESKAAGGKPEPKTEMKSIIRTLVVKMLNKEKLTEEDKVATPFRAEVGCDTGRIRFLQVKARDPVFIRSIEHFRKGRVLEFHPKWDEKGILYFEVFLCDLEDAGKKEKLPLTPRFDRDKIGYFDSDWNVETKTSGAQARRNMLRCRSWRLYKARRSINPPRAVEISL